jgi:hypothetical protein
MLLMLRYGVNTLHLVAKNIRTAVSVANMNIRHWKAKAKIARYAVATVHRNLIENPLTL